MSELKDINDAEELLLASALRLERDHCADMRGRAERHLANGDARFVEPAAFYEGRLATLDRLAAKLPSWFRAAVDA